MSPAVEGWREAGCRLTSRQTTMAANVAEREVLMACCQGDMGQPGSVSFADANETSELLPTLAKPSLETQTEPPPPRRTAPAYTWADERGDAKLFICFSRLPVMWLLYAPPRLPRLLWERRIAYSLSVQQPPHWHLPSIPLILCVQLAFSERRADSSVCC